MSQTMNRSSFVAIFICTALFFLATSSSRVVRATGELFHLHPLTIVFALSCLVFILGIAGLFAVKSGWTYARSIATILISACLVFISGWILAIGSLLE
ncbi:hypothetical protein KV679_02845 [Bacillus sp. JRC01]|nr:hypothetical protein [Bacillus sp. JRC01]